MPPSSRSRRVAFARALLVDLALLLALVLVLVSAWKGAPPEGFAGLDAAARTALARQLGAQPAAPAAAGRQAAASRVPGER